MVPEPQTHPPDVPGPEADTSKPTGFDTIYPRLKERRKKALKELAKSDGEGRTQGEASSTVLRAEDGGGIPEGSFSLHINWLHGLDRDGEPLPWWPDEEIQLIEVDRREDHGKGNKTKIYALTEYGQRFVRHMLDREAVVEDIDPHSLRSDLEEQTNRVDHLMSELQKRDERIDELEGEVEMLEAKFDTVYEYVEELEEKMLK